MITSDVSTEDEERSPQAILHRYELFKVMVSWLRTFAQPSVSYPDVQGVVVADAAWYNTCHTIY